MGSSWMRLPPNGSCGMPSRSCGSMHLIIQRFPAPGTCSGTWRESSLVPSGRYVIHELDGGRMLKRVLAVIAALLFPSLAAAQNAKPRATRVQGEAVGLDNRPVTPATPATRATPATPSQGGGRATPAIPATPATPASPSRRPPHAGQGGQGRDNNPRRP